MIQVCCLTCHANICQVFYVVETLVAYSVGNITHGLANNSMTDEERAALQPSDAEYQTRYASM